MNRGILSLFLLPLAGLAQIDQQRAAEFFNEAKTLCEREGGNLWRTSLCGPIVFADPATETIATNQPAPGGPRPTVLGYANAAMDWGGTRWTTISWPFGFQNRSSAPQTGFQYCAVDSITASSTSCSSSHSASYRSCLGLLPNSRRSNSYSPSPPTSDCQHLLMDINSRDPVRHNLLLAGAESVPELL
jgi:hypothetical protein